MTRSPSYWWYRVRSAASWYGRARTRYDVHSPYLTKFVREVYHDDRYYAAFDRVADLRRYWKDRREEVHLLPLGAGSKTTDRDRRTAANLVATNAVDPRRGEFLFRLALWHRPEHMIELGTNAGISTAYLHTALPSVRLDTVEGNPQVAALARETFDQLGAAPTLIPHVATFQEWLGTRPPGQKGRSGPDQKQRKLIFIDGDHRYRATLDYVEALRGECNDDSIIVVADIHWSDGMERAWKELVRRPDVTASVDTYHFGLLFFRREMNGPHLALVPTRYKPWRVGFFG